MTSSLLCWWCNRVHCPCMFNYLFCSDRAVPFPLPAVCAGLCYWLIESVFCAAALPWRLVLAHTHCSRTNENTPRHLPKRDTPSPSPCPSTLVPFTLFTLFFVLFLFLPSCTHLALFTLPYLPTFSVLPSHFNSFDPPFSLCTTPLFTRLFPPLFCHLHLFILIKSVCVCVFVFVLWGFRLSC